MSKVAAKPSARPNPKRRAKPPVETKRRTKDDGEKAIDIVRRHAAAHPDLAFGKIVELAVNDGVKPNTARGALVRIKAGTALGGKGK